MERAKTRMHLLRAHPRDFCILDSGPRCFRGPVVISSAAQLPLFGLTIIPLYVIEYSGCTALL